MSLAKQIKAFMFDVDGTLINRKCEMTEKMRETLRILRDKGYHLAINSGRPAVSTQRVLIQNDCADLFEYYFGSNGIEAYDVKTGKNSFVASLDPEILRDIDTFFRDDYMALAMYDEDMNLLFNHFPKSRSHIEEWCKVRYATPKLYDYQANDLSFPKAIALFEVERKDDFMEKIKDFHDDRVDNFMSGVDVMEIVPKGYSKERAVYVYAEMLGIDPKEIMCAGDAQSDLPALFAGTGLFVGDASAEGKEKVPYHCADVHNDGIYSFLKDNDFLD